MIALFETTEPCQAYCDERSKARGCPVIGTTSKGKPYVKVAHWDEPHPHPNEDGRAWCAVDPSGDDPSNCELVEKLPREWIPPTEIDWMPVPDEPKR
jgi:hypothetical protein